MVSGVVAVAASALAHVRAQLPQLPPPCSVETKTTLGCAARVAVAAEADRTREVSDAKRLVDRAVTEQRRLQDALVQNRVSLDDSEEERFELRRALEAHVGALVEAKVDEAERVGEIAALRETVDDMRERYKQAARKVLALETEAQKRVGDEQLEQLEASFPEAVASRTTAESFEPPPRTRVSWRLAPTPSTTSTAWSRRTTTRPPAGALRTPRPTPRGSEARRNSVRTVVPTRSWRRWASSTRPSPIPGADREPDRRRRRYTSRSQGTFS